MIGLVAWMDSLSKRRKTMILNPGMVDGKPFAMAGNHLGEGKLWQNIWCPPSWGCAGG